MCIAIVLRDEMDEFALAIVFRYGVRAAEVDATRHLAAGKLVRREPVGVFAHDIRVAQAVLNHRRADTTDSYIRAPQTRRLQRETIARLQAMMVAWVAGDPSKSGAANPCPGPPSVPAESFGYRCAGPLAGVAGDRLCPHFGGCLACPGLVIPIDAEHLARVLLAVRQLETARRTLDPQRWALLYGPSHRILTEDILPDFPAVLRAAAERLIPTLPPLPSLE